jgi:hypothetical protein
MGIVDASNIWHNKITDFDKDQFTLAWLNRAVRTPEKNRVDDGDRFMSLWVCFNSILKKEYGEQVRDKDLIKKAKNQNSAFHHIFNKLLETVPFSIYFSQLKKFTIVNQKNPKSSYKITTNSWSDLIEAIYNTRCNLFHGRKNPEDIKGNDYTITFLSYNLLLPIIAKYLENERLAQL